MRQFTRAMLWACAILLSIILLLRMVGTSFVLVAQTRLNVSEPEYWVTWSHRTPLTSHVWGEKESNTSVFLFWKLESFCLLLKHFLTKLKDFCLRNFVLPNLFFDEKSGSYCGLMDNKSNIFVLNRMFLKEYCC